MFDELIRRWWIIGARALVSLALGIALFAARVQTLGLLVILFGGFAFADGVFVAGAGLAVGWLPIFLEGTLGMVVGVFTFFYPASVDLWFVPLIVTWAVVTGALELIGAARLRRGAQPPMVRGARLLGLNGATSMVFGIVFALRPSIGALTGILAVYAVASGLLLLLLALNIRTWPRVPPPAIA